MNELVSLLMEEDDGVNPNSPFPIESQLASRRAYYERILELKELKANVLLAHETLQQEVLPSLPPEKAKELESGLHSAIQKMGSLTEDELRYVCPDLLGISRESITCILEAAEAYYLAEHFKRAYALFTLLTLLHNDHSEYWFFRAASEQELGLHKQACESYRVTLELDPYNVRSQLLFVEACIESHEFQEAELGLEEAQSLLEEQEEVDPDLIAVATDLAKRLSREQKREP